MQKQPKRIPYKERIKKALEIHKTGVGIDPVAKVLNCSRTQAYKILQQHGSTAEFVRVPVPTRDEIAREVAKINKHWSMNDRKVRWVGQYARG